MKNKIRLFWAAMLALASSISVLSQETAIETRFSGFYMGGAAPDFHPDYRALIQDGRLEAEATRWAEEALTAVAHFNFTPLERENLRLVKPDTKVGPNVIFIRGLVSRADIKTVERWKTDVHVFLVTVTLEFFDLASGEVFYTRTLAGQSPAETAKGVRLSPEKISLYFRECLKGTILELVKRTAEYYQPGLLQGRVVSVLDSASLVINLGRVQGIYKGMTLYFYGDDSTAQPAGMLKAETPQENLSLVKVIILQGEAPRRETAVKSFGANRLARQKDQTRYMVAGFPVISQYVSPEFKVDPQSLGQWLHDGLSEKSDLFMLAPLLAKLDSLGNLQVEEALFYAQETYSIFGNLAQSAALGNRAYPDILIKGAVSFAEIQPYQTPGAENLILKAGVSIQFYDRKTREFLYACQHEGFRVEKLVRDGDNVLRKPDLDAGFRTLCERVISEAAAKIAENYRPRVLQGKVTEILPDQTLNVVMEEPGANIGDAFDMLQVVEQVQDLDGKELGPLYKTYAIARLTGNAGENRFTAAVLVSDGQTPVQAGDLLRAEGKRAGEASGPLHQVSGWEIRGKVIAPEYRPPAGAVMMGWLFDALLSANKIRLLPPDFLREDFDMAEGGLRGGYFEPRDQGEIMLEDSRVAEISILGRLGHLDVQRKTTPFRNELKLIAGVEVAFTNAAGDTLLPPKQLALSKEEEQTKDTRSGEIVKGPIELSPEFDDLIREVISKLVEGLF